ncbi:MAG: hypothetical protein ABGW77_02135 [Campylobacterales bacterium]
MGKSFKKLVGIIAVGIAVGVVGCSSGKEPKQGEKCVVEGEEAPQWVCQPEKFNRGMIVAVGIAEEMPPSIQLTQAEADGRNRLASQIATEVKREIRRYQGVTTPEGENEVNQQLEDISIQLSRVLLRGSRPLAQWRSENRSLYILIGVPKSRVQTLLKRHLKDLDLKFRELEK